MFYGDLDRRQRAVEVLRNMRKEGKHPLSKVPHLGDPELDNYVPQSQSSAAAGATVTPVTVVSDRDNGSGECADVKAVTVGEAEAEAGAVTRPISTVEDIVTEGQPACSSSSTPPLASTSTVEGKSSISVIARIDIGLVLNKVDIGLEMATHATEKESIIRLEGIEEEVGQRAEYKVEVEIEAGAMATAMTSEEGIPPVEEQGGSETDKEYLVRTCRYVPLEAIQ